MPFELIYTSAPRGLKAGTVGFSTVAKTEGIPPQVASAIEALSVFRKASSNDFASFSQLVFKIGGASFLVFSRIGDAGFDYSGRSNFIAHHWAFGEAETTRDRPNPTAFWENEREFFLRNWENRDPEFLVEKDWTAARRKTLPRRCDAWEAATADAGWGAVFAASALEGRRVSLIVPPQIDPTPLFWEALSLIPPRIARTVSFATSLFQVPFGVGLNWRGVWAGTPDETAVRSTARDLVFDASEPNRVSILPGCSKPEDAAALASNDSQFFARIEAARRGVDGACKRSVLQEGDVGESEQSESGETRESISRLEVRRVAVPEVERTPNETTASAADERVVLRRRGEGRPSRDGEKAPGFGDDWTAENEKSDGFEKRVFVDNDQKNVETERLNEIYSRLAQEGDKTQRKLCKKIFCVWIGVAAFCVGVFFAFRWLLQENVPERSDPASNATQDVAPKDVVDEVSAEPLKSAPNGLGHRIPPTVASVAQIVGSRAKVNASASVSTGDVSFGETLERLKNWKAASDAADENGGNGEFNRISVVAASSIAISLEFFRNATS